MNNRVLSDLFRQLADSAAADVQAAHDPGSERWHSRRMRSPSGHLSSTCSGVSLQVCHMGNHCKADNLNLNDCFTIGFEMFGGIRDIYYNFC
jgi:hypothetical protein